MPRAKRICPKPGCPNVVAGRYCPHHNREYEAKRGTKKERGYDARFQELRRRAVDQVEAGGVSCWRCGQPIPPGSPFDMGHDDRDRTIIRGPEHPRCNRSAAGKSAHLYS